MHIDPFPDETSHHYPLGDVPEAALKRLFDANRKMQLFEDAMTFVYNEQADSVEYRCNFNHLNPEAIYPDASDWIDALRIAKVTTWTPEKGPYLDAAMFDSSRELADKIDFLFWAKSWFVHPVVHIGVYNSRPEDGPVDFTIRMRDFHSFDTYPDHVKAASKVYDEALVGVDANDTSF